MLGQGEGDERDLVGVDDGVRELAGWRMLEWEYGRKVDCWREKF